MKKFDSNLIETTQNESEMETLQPPVSINNPENGEEQRPLNDTEEFDKMLDDFIHWLPCGVNHFFTIKNE